MAKRIRDRWKNKKPSKEAQEKYDKWCEGRPTVGETRMRQTPTAIDDRFEVWDGSKWCEITSNDSKPEGVDPRKSEGIATPGFGVMAQTIADPLVGVPTQEEFDELKERVDGLSQPEEALVEKAKDLNEQYNDDIDGIFQEYHDRNKRRDELNERISRELGKDEEESRGWLYPTLAIGGSLAALSWAGYTLYPHLEGIRYYIGF